MRADDSVEIRVLFGDVVRDLFKSRLDVAHRTPLLLGLLLDNLGLGQLFALGFQNFALLLDRFSIRSVCQSLGQDKVRIVLHESLDLRRRLALVHLIVDVELLPQEGDLGLVQGWLLQNHFGFGIFSLGQVRSKLDHDVSLETIYLAFSDFQIPSKLRRELESLGVKSK